MATLEQYVSNLDLPRPEDGEDPLSYARRVALVGAHTGAAWAMTHRPAAIVENVTEVPDGVLSARLHEFLDTLDKMDDGGVIHWKSGLMTLFSVMRDGLRTALNPDWSGSAFSEDPDQ